MFDPIFHPSDFTETSDVAFCHALRIAVSARADLQLLHVDAEGEHSHRHDFPSVRELLEQWKVLPPRSRRTQVTGLGIDVRKAIIRRNDPVAGISKFLARHPASLIVMAAHRSSTLMTHSGAESIVRKAAATTLIVPEDVPGFVSLDTGKPTLENVLIPIAGDPPARPTIQSIRRLIGTLGIKDAKIHFLHVGGQSTSPPLPTKLLRELDTALHVAQGNVVSTIIDTAIKVRADLVAMTTKGHHGFLDALRGDTTEQVLRQIRCPLWAVSAH